MVVRTSSRPRHHAKVSRVAHDRTVMKSNRLLVSVAALVPVATGCGSSDVPAQRVMYLLTSAQVDRAAGLRATVFTKGSVGFGSGIRLEQSTLDHDR